MLRSRVGRIVHDLPRYVGVAANMSTAVRDGGVEGTGGEAKQKEEYEFVFPWLRQEMPVLSTDELQAKRTFWKRSLLLLRSQMSLEIIRHFLSHPSMETMSSSCGINYMDPRGGEFLTGARQAFTVCSNTIFKEKATPAADEAMLDSAKFEGDEAAAAAALGAEHEEGEMGDSDIEGQKEVNHAFDASGTPVPRSHPASKSDLENTITKAAEMFHSFIHGAQNNPKEHDYDTASPIEYANAWNTLDQPPSTRFASGALDDVLDSRLAAFFDEALQNVSKKHNLHHILHQVYMPSISHCEIIFNAQRGFNFDLIKRHYIFGVIGAAVLGDPPQKTANKTRSFSGKSTNIINSSGSSREQLPNHMHAFSQAGQQRQPEQISPPTFTLNSRELSEWLELPHVQNAKSELKKMTHLATIRVHVNLPCKETFFVSEKESGLIVQGDCIPRDSTHQIVLEGSFSVKDMNFPEFQIVDIDNWLEGNRFV